MLHDTAFQLSGAPTDADAEQWVLEGCELKQGAPCVLVATGSALRAPDPRVASQRLMERLHYAGPFRLNQVPMGMETRNGIRDYMTLPGARAIAIRPAGFRAELKYAAATQPDAEREALARCNDDGASSPCFLYATGDQVVLPERRTQPTSTPSQTIPEPALSAQQEPALSGPPERPETPHNEASAPALRGVPEQTRVPASPVHLPPRSYSAPPRPVQGEVVTRSPKAKLNRAGFAGGSNS